MLWMDYDAHGFAITLGMKVPTIASSNWQLIICVALSDYPSTHKPHPNLPPRNTIYPIEILSTFVACARNSNAKHLQLTRSQCLQSGQTDPLPYPPCPL